VPCTGRARHELQEPSIAPDQEERRHAQAGDRCVIRMGVRIEPVGEQPFYAVAAEFTGRQ
jgi:hypothetical protein